MKKNLLLFSCSFFLCFSTSKGQILLDSTVLDTSTIITGIDIPWEITWGPDDWIWMTERFGRVSRVNPATGVQDTLLNISASVYNQGEAGLLGLALHPDFMVTPQVFLVYTYEDGGTKERLVRYDYNGTALVNPFTIVENITGNITHNGSRLHFLADNTLLMSTGDAQAQGNAQNLGSLSGKMLRFNIDGSIPADNPFPGDPIWSWGHRNPQGLVQAPNGIIYSSEHGPTTDDEVNLLEKGRNYGWPTVHGFCDLPAEMTFCTDSNVSEPLVNWTPTIAPSDLVWYDHPAIPEFRNSLLMSVLKEKMVVHIQLDAAGTTVTNHTNYFINQWGRLRDICVSPDGAIYLATNGPQSSNTQPFTHSIIELKNSSHPVGRETWTAPSPKIWPQPATGSVNIQLPAAWIGARLTIHNITGQLIDELILNNPLETYSTGSLQAGWYLLSFRNSEHTRLEKMIVR